MFKIIFLGFRLLSVSSSLFSHFLYLWVFLYVVFFKGKMIVLDLQSEQWPQYDRLKEYFGQPFIWCMLHDFGGTLGMFGSSTIVNDVSTSVYKLITII